MRSLTAVRMKPLCGGCIPISAAGYHYSPYDSLRKRPTQSPAERRRDEQIIFPKTTKSGRYEHQATLAQRLYEPEKRAAPVDSPDARFFRKHKDYREIQDPDPHAALFGESTSTQRIRVREWQKQFEKENEDVWLPYERDTALKRAAPNWFVRHFVQLRDSGGADSLVYIAVPGGMSILLLSLWLRNYYVSSEDAKPLSEVR
jgi:hypothetical protein